MSDIKAMLFKCFQELDESFFENFVSNIDKRIAFQKYGLFFSVIFGLRFGDYSLYIHGPYNSTMADIGYEFANDSIGNYRKIATNINFNETAMEIINRLKEYLSINNIPFLEVFSTYFYLLNCEKETEEIAIQKTEKIKKDLINKYNIQAGIIKDIYNNIKIFINNLADEIILV